MKIPSSLKAESKYTLIRIIRAMQSAIKAECCRCMGVENLVGTSDCGGLNLEDGNCPLYEFRPWAR